MKACGIRLIRNHVSWLFGRYTGLQVRDFELGEYAWVKNVDDPGGRTLYACDSIPGPGNGWAGQNYMGWCNPTASDAIVQASDTGLSQQQRKGFYATVINAFAEDVPSLPLFFRQGSTVWEHIDFNLETFKQEIDVLPTSGGVLAYTDYSGNQGTIAIPVGAMTQTTTISYAPLVMSVYALPHGMDSAGAFRVTASFRGIPQDSFSLATPVTVTVRYSISDTTNIRDENSLNLYYWDKGSTSWKDASETCSEADRYKRLDTDQDLLELRVCHFSEFGLLGISRQYFPLQVRNGWMYSWTNTVYAESPVTETIWASQQTGSQYTLFASNRFGSGQFMISTSQGYQWVGYGTRGQNPFPLRERITLGTCR